MAKPLILGRIETFFVPPRWLMVRIESEDGAVGWGEASLEGHAEAVGAPSRRSATASSAMTATASRTSGRSPIAAASIAAGRC
jgi:L-alanine-DL-glutamate epimerase-like enolase superfamily enzyme